MTHDTAAVLRPLRAGYVEEVRFSLERRLETAIRPFLAVVRLTSREPESPPSSLVPLTRASATRVYRIAENVAAVLDCRAPFSLFQTRTAGELNAQALYGRRPFAIRLMGPVVSILDDGSLSAMIGHEFGHYLAHGIESVSPSILHRPTRLSDENPLYAAAMVATELTADRFALLGSQSLDATVRLEVASATGVTTESLGLQERDHLAEIVELVENGNATIANHSHPSREFRMYATWLFWRSDTYNTLTGQGPADLTLTDVDDKLSHLLLTPELARALASQSQPEASRETRDRALPTSALSEPTPSIDPLELRFQDLEARDRRHLEELESRFARLEKGEPDED